MKFLITGGTGFIGSYVVRDLLKEDHEVVCFQRSGITSLFRELVPAGKLSGVKIVRGTITDYELLSRTIQENKTETIIHTAWCMPPESEQNVPLAIRTNLIGTNNIFEAARTFRLKRVVWTGSNTTIGKLGGILPNNYLDGKMGTYNPGNFYGAAKALSEIMADRYINNYGMDIISLRLARIFGPGKNTGNGAVFTRFVEDFALGNPVTIRGGDTRWTYLYVEDTSQVLVKAAQAPYTGNSLFNINDGSDYNGWELAEILKQINPKAEIHVESGKAIFDFPRVDSSAYRKEFNLTPRSLKESLRQFANYFRRQNNLPELLKERSSSCYSS